MSLIYCSRIILFFYKIGGENPLPKSFYKYKCVQNGKGELYKSSKRRKPVTNKRFLGGLAPKNCKTKLLTQERFPTP
jgi:hypothetical protein